MNNIPLTIENASMVSTIISIAHPEWGTKKFNHNAQPLLKGKCASTFGTGSDSAVLFEKEFKFWKVATFKMFNFWKGNKIANHFQLTQEEVVARFQTFMKTKDVDWLEHYTMDVIVPAFISEELESIGNVDNQFLEYRILELILKPHRNKIIDKIEGRLK